MLSQTCLRTSQMGARLVGTSAVHNAQSTTSVDTMKKAVDGSIVPPPKRSSLSKAGSGGRMSYSGNVVTVFGANGLLGTHVVNRMAKDGTQIVVPYRCDPYNMRDMKTSGDLGQILFFPFGLRDEESIRKAVKYSNVVVNLIGTTFETKNYSFYDTNEHGARRIARISREMGVDRLIHISQMGASHTPKATYIPGGSHLLRSKAAGEDAVREEFPTATIIRPAPMFGFNDSFIRVYINLLRSTMSGMSVELHEAGENTFKMVVYKNDVASGIARVVSDPAWDGQTLEFVGPHNLKLAEMARYIQKLTNDPVLKIRRGYGPMTHANVLFGEWNAWYRAQKPVTSWEYIETVEAMSDRLTGVPTLGDVIGHKHLHHFEWSSRLWPVENTYGWADRVHFEDELRGNKVHKINHYPFLYADEGSKETAFEQTFQTAD